MTADAHNWVHGPGTDYRYDVAGNMTYDATSGLSYTFDQENRITGANGYGYIYDGDGNRVEKVTPPVNPASGTLYWYMTPGIVAESDLTGAITSEYISLTANASPAATARTALAVCSITSPTT